MTRGIKKVARVQDSNSKRPSLIDVGALGLALAGILFLAWPVIRPFSESSGDPVVVATTFASLSWIAAHVCGLVAFVVLALGLSGLYAHLAKSPAERTGFWGLILGWIGIGLALPFFGIEAFSLRIIGQKAMAQDAADLVALGQALRMGTGVVFFFVGLLLLGVAGLLIARAVWKSTTLPRWSGIPLGLGLALYIPQFALPQIYRVAHGLLTAAGCMWLSRNLLKRRGVA